MANKNINRLKSISDLHRFNQLPSPEHPLISLIDYSLIKPDAVENELRWIQEFYTISRLCCINQPDRASAIFQSF